jgi:hypothetical protein
MDSVELTMIEALRTATTKGLAVALDLVPVQTGKLKSSIAVVEANDIAANGTISFTLTAGGDDVDYALDVELREPFLDPALGVIRSALFDGVTTAGGQP